MSRLSTHPDTQLTLDQLVTVDRSVHELRTASERALSAGMLRYGNELAELADKLCTVLLQLAPPAEPTPTADRPRASYCPACGLTGHHWPGCPQTAL